MIDRILRLIGFDVISREEAALQLMTREISFKWRPVIVEERRPPRNSR